MVDITVLRGAGVILALAAASAAVAQTAGAALELEEVVVTAQKRSENLQDIPKQVQVVSTEQLRSSNVMNLIDLNKLVPSLSGPNNQNGGGATSIRGIGTAAPNTAANSKVGIVLDDVPIPSRAQIVKNLLDVDQVEVLPGPQGTLAGRNATGGLINLVTRKPSRDKFTGSAQVSQTSDHETTIGAYVSAPINEQFAFSLSANHQDLRGLAYNVYLKKWDVAANYTNVRGKLLFAPNDHSEVVLTVGHATDWLEGGGSGSASAVFSQIDVPLSGITSSLEIVPTGVAKKTFTQLLPGITPSPRNIYYYSENRAQQQRKNDNGSLRYENNLDEGTFTFIASTMREEYPQLQDWLNYMNLFPNLNIRPEFDGYAHLENFSISKTFEARFASRTDQPWTYLAGVFYSDGENRYNYQRYYQPFWGFRAFGSTTQAAFGSTSYTFPSRTTVRAGVRLERDDIRYHWEYATLPATSKTQANGIVDNFPVTAYPDTAGKSRDTYINYDLSLQQKINDDVMLYATYAHANQGPIYDGEDIVGSQAVVAGSVTAANPKGVGTGLTALPSEQVDSIELGIKSEWLDKRLLLNANFFNMEYKNYQALTNVTDTTNPLSQPILKTWSAGKASARGVEVTGSALLGVGFRIDLAAAYNVAKIKEWFNAPCFTNQSAAEGCITGIPPGEFVSRQYQRDISGNPLANAPKLRYTLIGSYTNNIPLFGGLTYKASLTFRHDDKQAGDQLGAPNQALPAANYLDAALDFTRDKLQVSIFGVNLNEGFAEGYNTILGQGLVSATPVTRRADGTYPVHSRTLSRNNVRYGGIRVKWSF